MGRNRREKFTAKMDSFISQLHDYREYFGDSGHRAACTELTGLNVPASPGMVMIAGRDSGMDRLALYQQLQRRGTALQILTFDDVRSALLREHSSRYGSMEDLAGISIFAVVSFHPKFGGRRRYFLDAVDASSPSRCSVYIDEADALTFEVTDRHGVTLSVSANRQQKFELDRFYLVGCGYGASDDLTVLQIRLDDRLVAEQRLSRRGNVSPSIDLNQHALTIGADVTGQRNGPFDLGELMITGTLTPFHDRLQMALYFAEKWLPERLSTYDEA